MSQSAFVKSTLILTVATLISKLLGSIFRIPLQNIAGDEVLGIFSLVYPVYMVALILSVAGIPIAISKLIAEAKAKNEQQSIKEIYITASILALLFGIISFSLIYSFSSPIAAALGGSTTRLALIVVAATLLIAPYMAVYRGFFQGFGDMRPTAISQVIEQFIRVSLILAVAYILVMRDYSNEIVAGGLMTGSVVGAFVSLVYLRIKYNRSFFKVASAKKYSFSLFSKWSKRILNVSIPIAIGTITMALMNFVDSFTIPYGLKASEAAADGINYLYGIYGRGLSLVQIATVFATSIVLPLIPLITKQLANKDYQQTRVTIEKSYRMTHIISWPAAIGLFSLTLPLNLALFTNIEGSWVLAIIGLSSVFTSFTILGTGILQGMNFAKAAAIIILSGVVIKVFSNIYLINLFGLNGAALSTLIVYILLFAVNTLYLFKKLRFTPLNTETVKIILASVTMGAVIGIPTLLIGFEGWTRFQASLYLFAAILFGIAIYLLQLFVFKIIDKKDLKRLPLAEKFIK
ncbi:polysaccharide biosynthesis/transport protein [Virgibacillus indicus]|uniref:Polysaccharide biosynthesis/transport protein n=1 Tax=Virgibacillus indicus TaxID=2024554 RepID=A0A265NAQ5_9BACI|nr:polysaccharide biosynthesis protein [Virgibacillus indicus]OZU88376.1 polysaccharide biosynthesis/transport protein [Virgibacillus indicus]